LNLSSGLGLPAAGNRVYPFIVCNPVPVMLQPRTFNAVVAPEKEIVTAINSDTDLQRFLFHYRGGTVLLHLRLVADLYFGRICISTADATEPKTRERLTDNNCPVKCL
jgi:hypothetical protein